MRTPLLEMRSITKSFPGVKALDGVSFKLEHGEACALMGENGAGKSTLMKCLFGTQKQDSGEVLIEGCVVNFKSPKEALDGGVAMVHQELSQALKLTVAENMWLGRFPRYIKQVPIVNERRMRELTLKVFEELGLALEPTRRMEELSVSERQMAEIAKAVSYDAKIIIFDEPTSSLNEEEVKRLFDIIRKLKSRGCGIVYISHKMAEIHEICDTVTVMRDGRHIATATAEELTTDKIIRLMVGRELSSRYPKRVRERGEILFEAEEISTPTERPKNASLKLYRGEILGIAGLEGAGRTELLEAIYGLSERTGGRLLLDGKEIQNRTPREAIKNGFALLTEERRTTGIFGILDITANTTISSIRRYTRGPIISDKAAARSTEECIKKLRIKTPSQKAKIRSLSGGNQQKVIIGRWLLTEPTVLMLDEPTRGIDVGAKYEIYAILSKLADEGRGIIVVSSEMSELFGICDRIIVMSNGRTAGEVNPESSTQEEIMTLATKYLTRQNGE